MSHRVLPGIGNWVQRGFRIWPALRRAISVIAGVNSKAGSSVYRLARIGGMLAVFGGAHLQGEIIVSEVMFDTGSDESRWEWVELYNRGTTDIDLDGYYINRLGSAANAPTATPHIRATNGGATIVPAGGVAVVFDGQALGFDGARFRQAWELDANVRLIGAASFPTLTNSGTAFGFWSSIDDQLEDTEFDPESERDLVTHFDRAAISFDYRGEAFPNGNDSASLTWLGVGDHLDPTNWQLSDVEMLGVTESVATRIEGSPLNSDLDAANPGVLPPGSRRSGLLITEVMYNPRFGTTTANDAPWEWIEVFNNTGAVIDFTQTPYVLDDHSDAGAVPDQANLTLGRIPAGEAAILYDGAISEATFAAAWNRPSQSLNLIPVDEFPSLGNTSETIGIWGSFAKYREDRAVGVESVAQAVASLSYASGGDWPSSIQGASLYQLDLNSPSNEGANWALSGLNDAIASWNAHAVLGVIDDHDGGDLGSPGILLSPASPPNLSFNGDELINSDDVNSLVLEIIAAKAGNTPRRSFDVNNDGTVDNADLTLWLASAAHQNGFAEPYLRGDANIDGSVTFADFVALNNAWQHHDRSWIGGDFNADGVTNFADFVDLNNHWQQSITARTAPLSVPEPSVFALLGAAVVLRGMRRSLR